jgi:hypothetical protein
MRLFGGRKTEEPPAPAEPEPDPSEDRRFDKVVEIYPVAVKLLWHFYVPGEQGNAEGSVRELPGPIDESTADSVRELEKIGLVEVKSGF